MSKNSMWLFLKKVEELNRTLISLFPSSQYMHVQDISCSPSVKKKKVNLRGFISSLGYLFLGRREHVTCPPYDSIPRAWFLFDFDRLINLVSWLLPLLCSVATQLVVLLQYILIAPSIDLKFPEETRLLGITNKHNDVIGSYTDK